MTTAQAAGAPPPPDGSIADLLGFSRETETEPARSGGRESQISNCWILTGYIVRKLDEAGITDFQARHDEMLRIEEAVFYTGEQPCPLQDTCEKHRRALERGGRPRFPANAPSEPLQTKIALLPGDNGWKPPKEKPARRSKRKGKQGG